MTESIVLFAQSVVVLAFVYFTEKQVALEGVIEGNVTVS